VTPEKLKPGATFREIYSQADSCKRTLELADARSQLFDRLLPIDQYTDIILTGCGSSYNLARCASFAWSRILHRPVRAIASSELMGFPDVYLTDGAQPLVVAISRTGGTTEVQLAVQRLTREYDARALAVTGQAHSPVGAVCLAELAFAECHEESIVMTQAFTCMLTGLYLIADTVAGSRHKTEISQIPCLIAESIHKREELLRRSAEDERVNHFFFLGSGVMKGLADECALKMTEMALSQASSHRSLEFRHGPKAALDQNSSVILFPVAAERPYVETLLEEIQTTGAQILLVSDSIDGLSADFCSIVSGSGLSEFLRPALYAHIGQLLACWRATSRGLDPHSPRYLARTVLLDV